MPDVVYGVKGVAETVRGQKQIADAQVQGAQEGMKAVQEMSKAQLDAIRKASAEGKRQANEETKQARQKEQDWKRWNNIVQQTIESQKTGYQKLQDKFKEMGTAFQKTGGDEKTLAKARTQAIIEYNRHVDAGKRKIEETTDTLEKQGEVSDNAFDTSRIARWATSLIGPLAPLALIRSAIMQNIELQERMAQMGKETRFSFGSFRQLANTQAEYDALVAQAEALYKSGATTTLDQAGRAVFEIASAGMADKESFALLTKLGKKGVVEDISTLAGAARTILASVGPKEAGNLRQILAKSFAAGVVGKGSVEQIMQATASTGSMGRFLGISDEELFAAIALLSTSTGEPMTGATALESFLISTAEKPEFEGMNLLQRIKHVQQKKLTAGQLKEFLGRKEAVRGFAELENQLLSVGDRPGYTDLLVTIQKANQDLSTIQKKLDIQDAVRESALAAQQAQAEIDVKGQAIGGIENLRQAGERRREQLGRETMGWFFGGVQEAITDAIFDPLERVFGSDLGGRLGYLNHEELELRRKLLEQSKKQTEATEKIGQKLDNVGGLVGVAE